MEHKLLLVLAWEFHALECSVLGGLRGMRERRRGKYCLERCITPRGLQLKAGGRVSSLSGSYSSFPFSPGHSALWMTVDRR